MKTKLNKIPAEGAITEPVIKKGTLYISCGVPGSGKSTFLNRVKKEDEKVVSRDDVRFLFLKEGEEYFSHEKEVFQEFINIITFYVNSGVNVYADATHLNEASRAKLTDALLEAGCQPSAVEAIYFKVPIDICLERNENRKGTKTYVPQNVIRRMYNQMTYPKEFSKTWIVDENGNISKGV